MNKAMQEDQLTELATSTDELLVAQTQIEALQEQLELCYELMESQALELQYKEQQLQETEQELMSTNQELCYALNSEPLLRYHEAKQTAKAILARDLPVSEAIAGLLSAIYSSLVKPEELQQDRSSIRKLPIESTKADQLAVDFHQLKAEFTKKAQYNRLGANFTEFKAHLMHRREVRMSQKQDQESQEHGKTPLEHVEKSGEHLEQTKKILVQSQECVNEMKSRLNQGNHLELVP